MPTWSERVFEPKFYATTNEVVMISINSILLFSFLLLLLAVLVHRDSKVIRAATPLFCAVIIVGGCLMVASNYFATLHVNASHCVASTCLLTFGFTLTYAA